MSNLKFVLVILVFLGTKVFAQGPFSPAADSVGSNAIFKDSTAIVSWVDDCVITRGLQDISLANGPLATVGDEQSVYGKADGNVVSLGDGGSVTITLKTPLSNKPSYDFAVFENGLYDMVNQGYFLELAYVEVSSTGVDFYRFPNQSLTPTDTQLGTFGMTDPTNIDGLAGKYTITYGSPFDLAVLDTVSGLDINNITHIKIIDVVGSINPSYASYDSHGNIINDPYPTNFASSGFDLDAIAILDSSFATSVQNVLELDINIFPNPAKDFIQISGASSYDVITITDLNGRVVLQDYSSSNSINISSLTKGVYLIKVESDKGYYFNKLIKL
jgi:hypothetical protein